jgi:glucose-1-phosphate thymidylyltransferase
MKGIILCGGKGTRLYPLTSQINKHLLAIYNKPMVLYPLETLKSFGIKDILIVSGGEYIGGFTEFLGDGSRFGVNLTYRVQEQAGGIAEALGLAKDFSSNEGIFVILGDNIFDNSQLTQIAENKYFQADTAYVFIKEVSDPQRFGVPVFENQEIIEIEEKPKEPKSSFAVTGLYYYPNEVFDIIPTLKPSGRGELEITEVNNWFINHNRLKYIELDGYWSDAGTFDSLLSTANWAKDKHLTSGK